ncbi:hypothetical protein AVEN_62175-1 [Araneus ventricosus]|uniref:Uncharacterized protein n=1 Tax=Araneus ventricosus TaxID=182803 RepID=A0A4Y2PUR2_ARAVE|nr:hypothetical protein AVEN_62175-1 [Araneus ventricosus]
MDDHGLIERMLSETSPPSFSSINRGCTVIILFETSPGVCTVKTVSSKSRQRITNNNSNSRNNSNQRLTDHQLAKRTNLQSDSSNSADVQRRLSHLSNSRVFISFLTICDVT